MTPTVEMVDPRDLIPYEGNSRTHSPEQVEQIAASIEEFGFTVPILADASNTLIAGHGRAAAALFLGLERVPVIRLTHLTDAQRRAYVIADNKLTEIGGWDEAALAAEILSLSEEGFDLLLTGFNEQEIERLVLEKEDGETDPNAEWVGMPEFQQDEKTAFKSLAVHFRSQEDVDAFADLVGQKITEKTRFMWFPDIEIGRYADKAYE